MIIMYVYIYKRKETQTVAHGPPADAHLVPSQPKPVWTYSPLFFKVFLFTCCHVARNVPLASLGQLS